MSDLIGEHFQKNFGKHGKFKGKVTAYDAEDNLWHVEYPDGDQEDFDEKECKKFLGLIAFDRAMESENTRIAHEPAMQSIDWPGPGAPKAERMAWTFNMAERMTAKLNGPSAIPGLSGLDARQGTVGMEKGGHSMHADDSRLRDAALHGRVKHWLESGLKLPALKAQCKAAGERVTGNRNVLALRLALKNLPAECAAPAASATPGSKKRKAAKAAEASPAGAAQKSSNNKNNNKKKMAHWRARSPADAVAAIEQVVSNIEGGDCPWPLERAWLVAHCDASHQLECVEIVVSVSRARSMLGDAKCGIEPVKFGVNGESPDVRTLEELFKYGYGGMAAERLGVDTRRSMDDELGAAVPHAMVQLALEKKWDEDFAKPGEAERLQTLYAAWLEGTTWFDTRSGGDDPWGPWSAKCIMEKNQCGLRRGLLRAPGRGRAVPSAAVHVHVSFTHQETPKALVHHQEQWGRLGKGEAHYVQVWSHSKMNAKARSQSLGALEATEASMAAQAGVPGGNWQYQYVREGLDEW